RIVHCRPEYVSVKWHRAAHLAHQQIYGKLRQRPTVSIGRHPRPVLSLHGHHFSARALVLCGTTRSREEPVYPSLKTKPAANLDSTELWLQGQIPFPLEP